MQEGSAHIFHSSEHLTLQVELEDFSKFLHCGQIKAQWPILGFTVPRQIELYLKILTNAQCFMVIDLVLI